ncbi:MAG: isoprenylcysteine carboxylmethyltransferase family protein [Cytophagia bacterium]|nr:isoprenylcysteine carboxylmethyltransferase family protein [Cytophagia bacterium]
MWLDHLILFVGWLLFYGIHSALATERVKSAIGISARTYRLLYNLISTVLFFGMLLLGAIIYSVLLFPPSPFSNYTGLMLAAIGLFVIKRAFRNYSTRAFLGFKRDLSEGLKTTGVQAKIRHPLYTGTLLVVVGYVFFNPQLTSLTILAALLVYLPFGIRWEEKKLIKMYGEEYVEYRNSVPALFPSLNLKKNSV